MNTPAYRPLGAFRFGLALMVVAQHFQHLLPVGDRVLFIRMGFGIVAVAVFFVISGFVVAEACARFYRGRPLAFLGNRLLRVVPPYLAALALSVAVHAALWRAGRLALWDFPTPGTIFGPKLLLTGVFGLIPGFHPRYLGQDFEFIPFAWSLRVEMAFYLAATAIALLMRAWRHALAVSIGLGLLASLVFLRPGHASLLSDVPFFIAGIVLFAAVSRPGAWRIMLVMAAFATCYLGFASLGQHGLPDLRAQFVVLTVVFAGFVWLTACRVGPRGMRIDSRLGGLSYPLYLNHYVIGIALFDVFSSRGRGLYVSGVVLSLLLSWIMAGLVDQKLQHLRARLRGVRL